MSERSPPQAMQAATAGNDMFVRRLLFVVLFAATMAGSLALAALALAPGGLDLIDATLLALFAVTLPWMVAGFWNAVIGFLIMRFSADPTAAVMPTAAGIRGDEPVTASTAILLCIRNELPERMIRNVEPMLAGLDAAGCGACFHLYVLSDTSNPEIASNEQMYFAALTSRWRERVAVTYRHRALNTGYKAGNIRDFCERWGSQHDFALTLDADSLMTASAVLRLVRIMQADAGLGILQGLVVGLPSTSAFARVFQFGMRLGMRSYTIGSAWWQGDCGPYWGHNAVLRLEPFIAHCALPVLVRNGTEDRPHPQPRSDRSGVDASRRLRRTGAAAGRSGLGGESSNLDRIHPPRPALVPGQHAVLAVSVPPGPEAGQPLPAGVGDPDVHRLAGLDRTACARHPDRRILRHAGELHSS